MQSPRVKMRKELLRSSLFFFTANAPSGNQLKTFLRNISYKASLFNAIADPTSSNSKPSDSDSTNPKTSLPVIDASSSNRKPISLWPGMYHSPATQALWEARSTIFEKNAPVPSQLHLVAKAPSQSRTSIFYKFSSDYVLREQYKNPWNQIRMGKLVEDLDALAGTIAFKHSCNEDGTTRPLILVTASVDKMVLKKPILIDIDLTIDGAVTWVGRSSMEIQLELIQSTQDTSDSQALVANFTFVARDSTTGKSALINQISPETEHERFLWEEAEQRNRLRKLKRAEYNHVQNGDTARLCSLLAEGRIFSDMPALANRDSILMKDTRLENSFICQPQQRNIHGRIFGGFLMRRAFELAFSTAYVFAGAAPRFLEVDHVDFFKPVDVGNFLRLKSCVLYTERENLTEPRVNVEVIAHVIKPELRSSEVSNRFYLTFAVNPEAIKGGRRIRHVVPATEEEAIKVLERMDVEDSKFSV
ncbi:acyl-coenzyme A thioesterase 9, mitochondrial-like isoform X2 [Neltuma alba]|uniref:acyl-coenzyme A thioesterase 9, mitochondrial-like isoform X2 n=1 Tax=Neltuma alba TaxID=207710 RepID=UPI0010A4C4D6|nr:acyl-coenzyme A thioesterase 9, mitochondrial-like isoform X2 [Prosopis alba]XP_028797743.1 acyl-coenzyme A thioesterase 9, mitochondrial-like isoform X2 [Prosopis alba]